MDIIGTGRPTASEIAADVRARRRTPREVVEASLARIEALDSRIGAFQVVDPAGARRDADRIAARADLASLPLAGVPVAIKDNIDVAGLPTRHGSAASSPAPRAHDDPLVAALREAGAVVMGKTRLPELGIWGFTESRAHGGTRNPHRLDRNAGGSTGGGAAAVAAGFVPIALGSDGGGSLRIPAANCGVVGFKPSRGVVPLAGGQADHWFGCGVYGPIAASVADVVLALGALAGTQVGHEFAVPERPLRVAVSLRSPSPVGRCGAHARQGVLDAAARAREAGHDVIEADPPYPLSLINEWVRRWHAGIATDARHLGLAVAALEPRTRAVVAKGDRLRRRGRPAAGDGAAWLRRLDAWFAGFDVLLSPVIAQPAPRAGWGAGVGYWRAYLNGARGVPFTQAWNLAGFPALSLPVPGADGPPSAVQIIAPAGQDATVLALAAQLESLVRGRSRLP